MVDLFDQSSAVQRPLADRLRPDSAEGVIGQDHLLHEHHMLRSILEGETPISLVLWGPAGCGKTTIARIIAAKSGCQYVSASGVNSGVSDLKHAFDMALMHREAGKQTLMFVDEIHRFNRSQQDAFLPVVEDGTIILIGATTENPSFEMNAALLSRLQVVVLNRLHPDALQLLMRRAEDELGGSLPITDDAKKLLIDMADGDGRSLLNMCEIVMRYKGDVLDPEHLIKYVQKRAPVYDKKQDSHYNLISALHKSLRGSDVQAALYWVCRMLDGGEDPLYILRRLVRFAVEDIGMADPQALAQANVAKDAYQFLGSPEGDLAIAQCVTYLATAPKSNANYAAYIAAMSDARTHGSLMPPMHILNAPTTLMKSLGYAEGYAYDPNMKDGFSGQNYFPEALPRKEYYRPVARGFERDIIKRLEYWEKLRRSL